jgi:hypothetical protein
VRDHASASGTAQLVGVLHHADSLQNTSAPPDHSARGVIEQGQRLGSDSYKPAGNFI